MSQRRWVAPVLVGAILAGSVIGAIRAQASEVACAADRTCAGTQGREN